MTIDVSIQQAKQQYCIGDIGMIALMDMKFTEINALVQFANGLGTGHWLDEATHLAVRGDIDNCTKQLIKEVKEELKKAKALQKQKYPWRYRWAFIKTIIRYPFKTLHALWLLKSKSTR